MASTKISVVLTIYNMESCLEECMGSVLAQTFKDIEIICIDDGSTDSSLSMLNDFAEQDDRITVYPQENTGPALSRNRGLDIAQGEYVILLDSDDIYDSTFLEKLYGRACRTESDIVVCRSVEYDHLTGESIKAYWTAKSEQIPDKDAFSCADMYDYIFSAFIGWPWDKLYRRNFIETHGLRFPDLKNSEDLYFVFLSLVLAQRISFVDDELVKHRINRGGSVSSLRLDNPVEFYKGICLLKDALKQTPVLYEKLAWGYLNWSLDYTLWNIETLPDGETRKNLVTMLAEGSFPELELSDHGPRYFNLFDNMYGRYHHILDEAIGIAREESELLKGNAEPSSADAHPSFRYPVAFFSEIRHNGYRSVLRRARRKLFGPNCEGLHGQEREMERQRAKRATELPVTGKDSQ